MKVERIVCKSNNLVDIQEYIAELASVVRDKNPKSAEKLFNRLLVESVGDNASRVLEYVPCKIYNSVFTEGYSQFFGFVQEDYYYTNARELLNWGWSLDDVLCSIDFTNYKVFKCEAPYFIYGQVSTHNQLTTVSHSQRYADCNRGFWKPKEVTKISQVLWDDLILDLSPNELSQLMRDSGITRKEVLGRGSDMLQNRVFVIGGYTNNPNSWGHFFKQRLDKHTQLETREFVGELQNEYNNK